MPAGGPRPNSGRKSSAIEFDTSKICRASIEQKYGSLEEGCQALLDSKEPMLQRWVFEHALGKPIDKVQLDGKTAGKLEVTVRYAKKGDSPS